MKIGHIRKEVINDKTWLIMDIAFPGLRTRLTISKNENKKNSNQPDWYIWYNMNSKGQNIYKSSRVGALWNKTSKDGNTNYKDGYIEHPFAQNGRINIAVFEAKPENQSYTHEITWNPIKMQNQIDNYDGGYAEPTNQTETQIDIPDNKIPF